MSGLDALSGASVLLTGARGVVGSELARHLSHRDDIDLVLASTTGDGDVLGWDMGGTEPPSALRRQFDVVIHAAARTRWSQTPEEAMRGNVAPARALRAVVGRSTHLVFLSTAHAIGVTGTSHSDDLTDFRNPYEWSKARAERYVTEAFPQVSIVRFPMVVGRRTDGAVARFSGFYKVLNGLCSGLLPAIVGQRDARLDLVPVDDLCGQIIKIAGGAPTTLSTVAGGNRSPVVDAVLDVLFDELNQWRSERGVEPLPRPPLLNPDRWDRFFWPFVREELSPLQIRSVELFLEFRPYLSMRQPFAATHVITNVLPAFARSLRYWADHNIRIATAVPPEWTS